MTAFQAFARQFCPVGKFSDAQELPEFGFNSRQVEVVIRVQTGPSSNAWWPINPYLAGLAGHCRYLWSWGRPRGWGACLLARIRMWANIPMSSGAMAQDRKTLRVPRLDPQGKTRGRYLVFHLTPVVCVPAHAGVFW